MNPVLASESLPTSSMPPDLWIWAVPTLVLTAILGFLAGVYLERSSVSRRLDRAKRDLSRLFTVVMDSLESAQSACAILERTTEFAMNSSQVEQLNQKRNSLLDSLTAIANRAIASRAAASLHESEPRPSSQRATQDVSEIESIDWAMEPTDSHTKLPNREAFEENAEKLIEFAEQSGLDGGVLLIKVDKQRQLIQRFGEGGFKGFLEATTRILCKSIRDEDVVCKYGADTFGILMPDVHGDDGRRIADTIRNTIRHHNFRLEEGGPEIFVTASLGFATCGPGDNTYLLLNRAGDALAKSERRGRNQLHVYSGDELEHCISS